LNLHSIHCNIYWAGHKPGSEKSGSGSGHSRRKRSYSAYFFKLFGVFFEKFGGSSSQDWGHVDPGLGAC
jgi:hypothetical protein